MNLPTAALASFAAPLALTAAKQLASGAARTAESFSDVLQGLTNGGAVQNSPGGEQADSTTDIATNLGELASRFRSWLRDQGVTGDFQLELSNAGAEVRVSGAAAEQVKQLLPKIPELISELQTLGKQTTSSLGSLADNATLRIDNVAQSIRLGL